MPGKIHRVKGYLRALWADASNRWIRSEPTLGRRLGSQLEKGLWTRRAAAVAACRLA